METGSFSGEPQHEPSHAHIIPLTTNEGREQFGVAVHSADGAAVVAVHPFFHDRHDTGDDAAYSTYKETLKHVVDTATADDIPLVVLEEGSAMDVFPNTLARMGKEDGEVFVIETHDGSHNPVVDTADRLSGLARKLHDAGLTQADVNGSYMDISERDEYVDGPPDASLPTELQRYTVSGCAGDTVNTFIGAGIDARIGEAVYPGFGEIRRSLHPYDDSGA